MNKSYPAKELYAKLEEYFKPNECTDVFQNGLQFDNTDTIEKVYTATFTGEDVFNYLRENNAKNCMLFTHHPSPQRKDLNSPPSRISDESIKFMEENHISLFTYHIPLDRNGLYSPGNNLAKAINARPYEEFYFQNNVLMGVLCDTDFNSAEDVKKALEKAVNHSAKLYNYSENKLNNGKIAIMAGGASNAEIYKELREKGINLFITGVTNPEVSWVSKIHEQARLNKINLLGGGHHSTEKFAVMAMVKFFENLGIEAEFVPEEVSLYDI